VQSVTDSGGTTTITLSQPDTADNATDIFTFGIPPVLSVPTSGQQS
jgi:hypothetical protein